MPPQTQVTVGDRPRCGGQGEDIAVAPSTRVGARHSAIRVIQRKATAIKATNSPLYESPHQSIPSRHVKAVTEPRHNLVYLSLG
jgi:hypothetical protein